MNRDGQLPTLVAYWFAHRDAFVTSVERLKRHPVTSFMTLMMCTIALLLPTLLAVFSDNLRHISTTLHMGAEINVFLTHDTDQERVDSLIEELNANEQIHQVTFIPADQGLHQLSTNGNEDLINALPENPLPDVIVISPKLSLQTASTLQQLQQQLDTLPHVSDVKLNDAHVKRMNAILHMSFKLLIALSVIFSTGIIVIVANAIAVLCQQYHKEISLYKLVGATGAYIRRPFIYTGLLLSVSAALLTLLIVTLLLQWLKPELSTLLNVSMTPISIHGITLLKSLILLLFASILGYLGAFLSISWQLISFDKHLKTG